MINIVCVFIIVFNLCNLVKDDRASLVCSMGGVLNNIGTNTIEDNKVKTNNIEANKIGTNTIGTNTIETNKIGTNTIEANKPIYRIAFYNVENYFDYFDDSLTADDDFTPRGIKGWGTKKYYTKCNNLFKAISALGSAENLIALGLAEIENKKVLLDLCYGTPLRFEDYRIIHYDSPDRRGIDVAFIYKYKQLDVYLSKKIPVINIADTNFRTRDILYIKCKPKEGKDTLNIYITHFPSKYGGALASNPKRALASKVLRNHIDSVLAINKDAIIIAMGDFNAEPSEESLSDNLNYMFYEDFENKQFDKKEYERKKIVNLMSVYEGKMGSSKFREAWSTIDHIIVSNNLLRNYPDSTYRLDNKLKDYHDPNYDLDSKYLANKSKAANANKRIGYSIKDNKAHIFSPSYLLMEDRNYLGERPFRTFYGPIYLGGYSDHLPVYIDIECGF